MGDYHEVLMKRESLRDVDDDEKKNLRPLFGNPFRTEKVLNHVIVIVEKKKNIYSLELVLWMKLKRKKVKINLKVKWESEIQRQPREVDLPLQVLPCKHHEASVVVDIY